jgi:cysteinyl-tRNA synthetase
LDHLHQLLQKVEAAAIATHQRFLGHIHGGGIDLKFPHHENERAQSESITGRPFARTWLHNGMLRFGGDKMSKSLGNVDRLADALDREGAETLLSLFARAHYRSPLEVTGSTIEAAEA